jgi:hypothetical protein
VVSRRRFECAVLRTIGFDVGGARSLDLLVTREGDKREKRLERDTEFPDPRELRDGIRPQRSRR